MFDALRKKLISFIKKVEEVREEEEIEKEKEKEKEIAEEGKKEEEVTVTTKTEARKVAEAAELVEKKEEEKEKIKLTKVTKITHIFKEKVKLSEKDLENILSEFQLELIQSDVAYETSEKIMDELKKKLLNKEIPKNELKQEIKNSLREVLLDIFKESESIDFLTLIKNSLEKPFKIIFFGVNGGGKTTTIAKVAHFLMKNSLSVVFAAGDTFRAGAIEQIEKHAQNLNVRVIKHKKGADAAAVIYDSINYGKAKGIDVVLADTAGRMHTEKNLMDEMKKICRVNKPNLKIFVGDALTGNDAVSQADMFNKEVGIDAVILTKMDADAKGGCALSIADTIKKPIIFLGIGQKYSDLLKFDEKWFVDRILELE